MAEQQVKEVEIATCRNCGMALRGKPYFMGGSAYHPKTNEQCKVNFYGGYVCSRTCDFMASLKLEQTMPGHGCRQTDIGCYAREHLERNWQNG